MTHMTGASLSGFFLLFVLSSLLPRHSASQAVFYAEVEKNKVYQGAVFTLEYQLTGGQGQRFEPPTFEPFTLVSGPIRSQRTTVIGGKRSVSSSFTYTLRARAPGDYTIAPAKMLVAGETIRSNPLEISVLPPLRVEDQSLASLSKTNPYVMKAELSLDTAYAGQQIILDYFIYAPADRPVDRVQFKHMPDLTGFDYFIHTPYRGNPDPLTIGDAAYLRYHVRRVSLYAKQSGRYDLLPAQVQMMFGTGRRSFFGTNYQIEYAQSSTASLVIRQLPQPAPEDFSGAIGRYQVTYQTARRRLSTDDAITISTLITGDGHPQRCALPVWPHHTTLTPYDPVLKAHNRDEVDGVQMHQMSADYIFTTTQRGRRWILPSFTYFDIDSAVYRTIGRDTAWYVITPGSQSNTDTAQGFTYEPIADSPRIASLWSSTSWGRLFLLGLLLLLMSFWAWPYLRRSRRMEHISAFDHMRSRLTDHGGDTEEQVGTMVYVLSDYVREQQGVPSDDWTLDLLEQTLIQRGHPDDDCAAFASFLRELQMQAYAGSMPDDRASHYLDQALAWVDWLEAQEI